MQHSCVLHPHYISCITVKTNKKWYSQRGMSDAAGTNSPNDMVMKRFHIGWSMREINLRLYG